MEEKWTRPKIKRSVFGFKKKLSKKLTAFVTIPSAALHDYSICNDNILTHFKPRDDIFEMREERERKIGVIPIDRGFKV